VTESLISTAAHQRKSLLLMLFATLLSAVAQVLMKQGAVTLGSNSGLFETALGIFTTPTLFAGYALYGVFTVLMVLALRHGELSRMQPIIALTYVWVAVLSVTIFHETMNAYKLAGIAVIMGGVTVLGRGDRS
jgi:drug/metabolite transporter (DMT)-like permease